MLYSSMHTCTYTAHVHITCTTHHCRFKLLKWWVQSFLIGVPKIVCGFRDDSGIVQKLETFRTLDIPKQLQVRKEGKGGRGGKGRGGKGRGGKGRGGKEEEGWEECAQEGGMER